MGVGFKITQFITKLHNLKNTLRMAIPIFQDCHTICLFSGFCNQNYSRQEQNQNNFSQTGV